MWTLVVDIRHFHDSIILYSYIWAYCFLYFPINDRDYIVAASRLGRRPKRLKEALEQNHRSSNHTVAPIVPYPPLNPQQLAQLSMAELQRLLAVVNQNGKMPKIVTSTLKGEPEVVEHCTGKWRNGGVSKGGVSNGLARTLSGDLSNIMPNGILDVMTNGLANGIHDAMPNGISNGIPNGIPTGMPNGMANGMSNAMPNGMSNRMPNGMPSGMPNGLSDNLSNGLMNGMSNGLITSFSEAAYTGHNAAYTGHDVARVPNLDQLDIPELEEYDFPGIHMRTHRTPHVKCELGNDSRLSRSSSNGSYQRASIDSVDQTDRVALSEAQHEQLEMLSISGSLPVCGVKQEEDASPHSDSSATPDIATLLAQARIEPVGERRELVQQMIESVVKAHMQTCNYTDDKVKVGKEQFRLKMKNSPPGMVGLSSINYKRSVRFFKASVVQKLHSPNLQILFRNLLKWHVKI